MPKLQPVFSLGETVVSNWSNLMRTLQEAIPQRCSCRMSLKDFTRLLTYRIFWFNYRITVYNQIPLHNLPDLRLCREHRIGVLSETLQCHARLPSMRQRRRLSESAKLSGRSSHRRYSSVPVLRSKTGRPTRGVGFGGNFLRIQSPPSFVIDWDIFVAHQWTMPS
jgi:hypothetical protein